MSGVPVQGAVIVIGGGISGLAAAFRLSRAGVPVTVLESSDQLGGLGTFFEFDGRSVERFYHCIMPTDEHLLPMLDELDLADTVRWRSTRMGMVVNSRRYAFNSALDLLRFTPLTLAQRIRFGVVSLLLRRLGKGRDLDNLRTEDWLRGLYGSVIWEELFKPLFGSKFGDSFGDVPALYLWQRLGREKNVAVRGYPAGGYKPIIEALRAAIEGAGGTVRTGAPVAQLSAGADGVSVELPDGEQIEAAWAISTVPLPTLAQMADTDLAPRLPVVDLRYQGVVNVLVFLRRPLEGHYWAPVLHSGTEFDGVIEMSALSGPETYGGLHLAYAMHYTDRSSPLFSEDPEAIGARWTEQLLTLYADMGLTAADVAHVQVFRAPFVEPVYPLRYTKAKPSAEVAGTRLLLATTAQIYPDVTSWNSSTGLSNRVVDGLLARIGAETSVPA